MRGDRTDGEMVAVSGEVMPGVMKRDLSEKRRQPAARGRRRTCIGRDAGYLLLSLSLTFVSRRFFFTLPWPRGSGAGRFSYGLRELPWPWNPGPGGPAAGRDKQRMVRRPDWCPRTNRGGQSTLGKATPLDESRTGRDPGRLEKKGSTRRIFVLEGKL